MVEPSGLVIKKGRILGSHLSMALFRLALNCPKITGLRYTTTSLLMYRLLISAIESLMVHSPGCFIQQPKQPLQKARSSLPISLCSIWKSFLVKF